MVEPQDILKYLQWQAQGQKRAKPAKDIAAHFGMGTRQVREMISELRRRHVPVCTIRNEEISGYYWPVSREDALPGLRYAKLLFDPLRRAYEGLLAGVDEVYGQPDLFSPPEDEVAV